MTPAEIYAEMAADRPSLAAWFDHRCNDIYKKNLYARTFPAYYWLEYRSPRRNRYLIQATAFSRRFDKRATIATFALHQAPNGLEAYSTWMGEHGASRIIVLPHAWKRYGERCEVGKNGVELIKHFLINNGDGLTVRDSSLMGASVRYNGSEHVALCVAEGVLLGEAEDGVFIARTFITYDMASSRQSGHFVHRHKMLLDDGELEQALKENALKREAQFG